MGYFVWTPLDAPPKEQIESAMANLKLWLESQHWDPLPNYLLDMAMSNIERAKVKLD